jgi:hypothetical protein
MSDEFNGTASDLATWISDAILGVEGYTRATAPPGGQLTPASCADQSFYFERIGGSQADPLEGQTENVDNYTICVFFKAGGDAWEIQQRALKGRDAIEDAVVWAYSDSSHMGSWDLSPENDGSGYRLRMVCEFQRERTRGDT